MTRPDLRCSAPPSKDLMFHLAEMYPIGYSSGMVTLLRSTEFNDWLANLRDQRGKARIAARLISAQLGNFGEYRVLDEGVCELKIDFGPGYRVYYVRRGEVVYLLLCGGDKSTQRKDIKPVQMARELKE
ncbi:putative addiction module killer protein [Burkholderia multivorans ATCC BAA-247]|nr:putative addiction module killer protein [Burkholderia multivorans ATCC BAA-247]